MARHDHHKYESPTPSFMLDMNQNPNQPPQFNLTEARCRCGCACASPRGGASQRGKGGSISSDGEGGRECERYKLISDTRSIGTMTESEGGDEIRGQEGVEDRAESSEEVMWPLTFVQRLKLYEREQEVQRPYVVAYGHYTPPVVSGFMSRTQSESMLVEASSGEQSFASSRSGHRSRHSSGLLGEMGAWGWTPLPLLEGYSRTLEIADEEDEDDDR